MQRRHAIVRCGLPVKNVPTAVNRLPRFAEKEQSSIPDVGVALDVQVVKVVCVFHLAGFGALQPLDNLSFHFHGYVSWQQGQQEPLLKQGAEGRQRVPITKGASSNIQKHH